MLPSPVCDDASLLSRDSSNVISPSSVEGLELLALYSSILREASWYFLGPVMATDRFYQELPL